MDYRTIQGFAPWANWLIVLSLLVPTWLAQLIALGAFLSLVFVLVVLWKQYARPNFHYGNFTDPVASTSDMLYIAPGYFLSVKRPIKFR